MTHLLTNYIICNRTTRNMCYILVHRNTEVSVI